MEFCKFEDIEAKIDNSNNVGYILYDKAGSIDEQKNIENYGDVVVSSDWGILIRTS